MTEYVAGFLYAPEKRVALIRKARPEWQRDRLNGVGGRVGAGETPVAAMVREFREEAGVETALADWTHCVTLRCVTHVIHFFRGERNPIPEEFVSAADEPVRWYRWDILPLGVVGNLHWLIPLCHDRDIKFPVELHDISDPATWKRAGVA